MSNITLSVDDEIIVKVRKVAIDKNTTLTQMIRDFLVSVAERNSAARMLAIRELEKSFENLSSNMGERAWKREDLYDR